MKRILVLLIILLPFIASAQPRQLETRMLQDYYYFGEAPKTTQVKCFVINNRKEFKKLFGETTRPDTPEFSKELMLVLLRKKTAWNAKLSFSKVCTKAGGFIEVYCDINEGKHKLTYESYPIAVCVIPRVEGVRVIDFYDNWKMRPLASLPVK